MEGIRKAGVLIGARKELNLKEGSNITLTIDDSSDQNNSIDVTIASTGGGGGSGGTPALVFGTANTPGVSTAFIRTDDTILAFDATSPSTSALGDAAVVGTATTAARRDHKHAREASGTTTASIGTSAGGVATTPSKSDHVHATGAGTPVAVSTANAIGTGPAAAMTDHVHAHETAHVAHDTLWDAAGDLAVGTGADTAARLAITVPAANILEVLGVVNGETTASWKAVHDGTAPTTSAVGDAASAGTALTAAHRDHVHGREAFGSGRSVTQAFGDTAADGTDTTEARSDHKHGMPSTTLTASWWVDMSQNNQNIDGTATHATTGTAPNASSTLSLPDAATSGALFSLVVPWDWASGAITYIIYWSPTSTDATPHTIRWSVVVKELVAASSNDVTAAGTTTTWTGGSAARTANIFYKEASQTLLTPTTAGNLIRVGLERIGADAADTLVSVVRVHGILFSYTATR